MLSVACKAVTKHLKNRAGLAYNAVASAIFGTIAIGSLHDTVRSVYDCENYANTVFPGIRIARGLLCGALWPMWIPYALFRKCTAERQTIKVDGRNYTYCSADFRWYVKVMPDRWSAQNCAGAAKFYGSAILRTDD